MTLMLTLFFNNLFPILLIASIGVFSGKLLNIEARHISRIILYILSPALVLDVLTKSQLSNGDMWKMFIFASSVMILTGLLAFILGRSLNLKRDMLVGVILTSGLINAGNYGLSLNKLAFGEHALSHASLFFVTSAIILNTIGVGIASLGKNTIKESINSLIKIPTIYAVILSLLLIKFGWKLPTPIERTTSLLSEATIPMMLILLGIQLSHHQKLEQPKALILSNSIRLLVSPVLALILMHFIQIKGIAFKAGMIEASMPTAVMSIVLATEFDANPRFVTSAVLTSTLLSPITLTPLLAFLGV